MLNNQVMSRICKENNIDPIALRLEAESKAVSQNDKRWGLTDGQSDVIQYMWAQDVLPAAVNLAITHYREVNGF
jgi:hypothetical protein